MTSPSLPPPPAGSEPAILFRPSKKRKIYRQRLQDDVDGNLAPFPPLAQSLDELIASSGDGVESMGMSMTEILRLRNLKKGKGRVGVEFRPSRTSTIGDEGQLAIRDADTQKEKDKEEGMFAADGGVQRKFTPQIGTVGNVDKHMMAYIDSELAKRQRTATEQSQSIKPSSSTSISINAPGKTADVQRQPAALGKLMEIDLGDEARSNNVERTSVATRRLNGEEIIEESAKDKPTKVRLGKDGKPWRNRKRRGSDDVARDKLVEEFLHKNRLDIYEPPPPSPEMNKEGDQAADDRIADAFRKEFMDAVSARQRKKTVQAPQPARGAGGKKEEEVLKGPKLGGSRSARAAMRETMLKNIKK